MTPHPTPAPSEARQHDGDAQIIRDLDSRVAGLRASNEELRRIVQEMLDDNKYLGELSRPVAEEARATLAKPL